MSHQRILARGAETVSRGHGVLQRGIRTPLRAARALRPHLRPVSTAAGSVSTASPPSSSASGFSMTASSPPHSTSSSPYTRDSTVDSILRVDHAGEYGAQCIYRGQLAALSLRAALASSSTAASFSPFSSSSSSSASSDSAAPPLSAADKAAQSVRVIEEMRDQEIEHLRTLERLLPQYHARPTAFLPLWHVAGYALGYGTALFGVRAAMACTVAVEEVITEHYNDQLRTLSSDEFKAASAASSSPIPLEQLKALRAVLRKHRDDEEHHRDIGIEHEAEQTPMYALLTNAIKAGCHVAINVAKVV